MFGVLLQIFPAVVTIGGRNFLQFKSRHFSIAPLWIVFSTVIVASDFLFVPATTIKLNDCFIQLVLTTTKVLNIRLNNNSSE